MTLNKAGDGSVPDNTFNELVDAVAALQNGGSQPQVSISTVTVGASPYALAFSPDGAKAYIGNAGDGTVSVIDVATGAVTNTITVGTNPQAITFTPDGSKAYVANNADTPGTLSIIDTATETVTGTVAGVGLGPITISITADGSTAYVVDGSDNTIAVAVVDVETDTVTGTVAHDPEGPHPILYPIAGALRPGTAEFWVLDGNGAGVVINADTLAWIATVELSNPEAIVFSPNGSLAYVADDYGVEVINASAKTIIATITGVGGNSEFGLASKSDGSVLYATQQGIQDIWVIDTASRTVVDTVTVAGAGFVGIAVSPDDRLVYALDNGEGTVKVLDATTNTLGGAITASVSLPVGDYTVTFSGAS